MAAFKIAGLLRRVSAFPHGLPQELTHRTSLPAALRHPGDTLALFVRDIPQLRDVAVTQDNFVIVCDVEQSPRRFGTGKDQCGKQNVCVYQYPHFTVPFHNALRL